MKQVVSQLNKIQGVAHALFVAFHNYHWNVKGLQFYSIHEYTEKEYDKMAELFDDMAERALQIGGKPLNKIEDLAKIAKDTPYTVKNSYSSVDVLENVKKAYTYLVSELKKLEAVADKANDATTANIAQEYYGKLEKSLWMLDQSLEK